MRESDKGRKAKIVRHTDLEVYDRAFKTAVEVFRLSKAFPMEEKYSLTDQLRRSSRSVAVNLAEGWRRRRYQAAFVNNSMSVKGKRRNLKRGFSSPSNRTTFNPRMPVRSIRPMTTLLGC